MNVVWQSLVFATIMGLVLVWIRRELRTHRKLQSDTVGKQIAQALRSLPNPSRDPSVIDLRRASNEDVKRFEALVAQEKRRREGATTPVAVPSVPPPEDKP